VILVGFGNTWILRQSLIVFGLEDLGSRLSIGQVHDLVIILLGQ